MFYDCQGRGVLIGAFILSGDRVGGSDIGADARGLCVAHDVAILAAGSAAGDGTTSAESVSRERAETDTAAIFRFAGIVMVGGERDQEFDGRLPRGVPDSAQPIFSAGDGRGDLPGVSGGDTVDFGVGAGALRIANGEGGAGGDEGGPGAESAFFGVGIFQQGGAVFCCVWRDGELERDLILLRTISQAALGCGVAGRDLRDDLVVRCHAGVRMVCAQHFKLQRAVWKHRHEHRLVSVDVPDGGYRHTRVRVQCGV